LPKNANISKVLIQIHSTSRSERLDYIFNYVFKWRMGIAYTIISDATKINHSQTVIDYNIECSGFGIHIVPDGLLFKVGTEDVVSEKTKFNLNPIEHSKSQYIDFFSSVFYHISRYEEYNLTKDHLGRFSHKFSCLFVNNFIEIPLVDEWIQNFKNYLIQWHDFKATDFKLETFYTQASIDIDSVFSYKGRNAIRTLAAFSKDIVKLNLIEVYKRMKVLLGCEKDPNDNFDLQNKLLMQKKAFYFVQVGKYGRLDKNISPENKEFQNILKALDINGHQIGLHPSFGSHSSPAEIRSEKSKLESIVGKNVIHSRQHYLNFELPKTYQSLIDIGIENEYSMGYSEIAGFRAGTAFPFHWYNLGKEQNTKLLIHPFVVMDVAFKNFLKMNVEETIIASGKLKEICKKLNAPFVFVFHNESLSNHRGWEKWDKVFSFWNHE
jgi:hypothetical protein